LGKFADEADHVRQFARIGENKRLGDFRGIYAAKIPRIHFLEL
jgi:hypothetical protein